MNDPTSSTRASAQPRAAAKPAAAVPAAAGNSKAEMRGALIKLGICCALTLLAGGIIFRFGILTVASTAIAVTIQITALVIYITTSDAVTGYRASSKPEQRDVLGRELRASRRRTGIRFVTFLVLAFVGVASFQRYSIMAYPYPWKVTDPSNRLFSAAHFAFTDYRTRQDLEHATQLMFPVGTPKKTVDAVLHDAGDGVAKVFSESPGARIISYAYSTSATRGFLPGVFAWVMNNREADKIWYVFVKFNAQNQVIGVSGTVQNDDSGALPYTQITPTGTTQPYGTPTALQLKGP